MNLALTIIALVIERVWGYPQVVQKVLGHPIEWMGALLGWLDRRLNRPGRGAKTNRWAGILALSLYLTVVNLITLLLTYITGAMAQGWIVNGVLASAFLAQKQLGDMVGAVALALKSSLQEGRRAVSHLVGRDTKALDEAEVSRAAIETLAENASDGVVAPVFWLLVFGLPGIVFYKAVNTADSMIGHHNERYENFGWAAARLDDVLNWIPARLTALTIALAAPLAGGDIKASLETARRDAPNHVSPNAGWPEAAFAGALGFGLGGPRAYAGELLVLPSMGNGRRDLGPNDIAGALRLYKASLNLLLAGVVLLATATLVAGHAIY